MRIFVDTKLQFNIGSCSYNNNIYEGIQNKKTLVKMTRVFKVTRRRPTLTGGSPQLPSALKSLTSVFGMGTGVTSLP